MLPDGSTLEQVIAAVAVLNVAIGLLVEATGAGFLRGIGAGWPSVFAGVVYGILAWLVRARSVVALGIAIALARTVEILDSGLRVTTQEGHLREASWDAVGRVVARQLPPDPPWGERPPRGCRRLPRRTPRAAGSRPEIRPEGGPLSRLVELKGDSRERAGFGRRRPVCIQPLRAQGLARLSGSGSRGPAVGRSWFLASSSGHASC